jgi:hypothetical protein
MLHHGRQRNRVVLVITQFQNEVFAPLGTRQVVAARAW